MVKQEASKATASDPIRRILATGGRRPETVNGVSVFQCFGDQRSEVGFQRIAENCIRNTADSALGAVDTQTGWSGGNEVDFGGYAKRTKHFAAIFPSEAEGFDIGQSQSADDIG